jgi:HlyD family secretion protein
MKRIHLLLALVLASCGAAAWWWFGSRAASTQWQGYIEADFVRLAPTQPGQLVALNVARGDKVKAGALLFVQDEAGDKAARDQATAQLAQAEAKLHDLQAASRDTEIQQAEAQLTDMRAARDRIAQDLARNMQLLRTGAATKQLVEQETADVTSASAHVDQAEARLKQMREPTGRQQAIQEQQGAVDAARAALAEAEWRLEQRRVTAPATGTIVDTYARPGEMLMAGTPVVELLPPENVFVRFFVPEPLLPSIRLGERMAIHCDVCGDGIMADVSFISPQAEYTPPVIYSQASRGKLVYLIEARPEGDAVKLNPGQPVDVRPLAPK